MDSPVHTEVEPMNDDVITNIEKTPEAEDKKSLDVDNSNKKDTCKDKVDEPSLKTILRPPAPFSQRLKKKQGKEALEKMPVYAKFMKDLVSRNPIASTSLVEKKEKPGAFTIPCTTRSFKFSWALCDLGANINLMPLVPSFIFLVDFIILECKVDFQVPIILDRPFLTTGEELVDMKLEKMRFTLKNEQVIFNVCLWMQHPDDIRIVSVIDTIDGEVDAVIIPIEERLRLEALAAMIVNFE
ncbi:uncharacterized protein LOC124897986 [Capsicum annuum]|uniref:uncharacterized protein LOC124897986 n=1 Tax=Capsicum annuum TaxID=4072 RepID=UPI001FB116F9|nr:uncharacterized protein LOC124897986 [Capsicum annuum]